MRILLGAVLQINISYGDMTNGYSNLLPLFKM